jgi:O-antigen/teichoic acid export membrane protein
MELGRAALSALCITVPIALVIGTFGAVLLHSAYRVQLPVGAAVPVALVIPAAALTLNARLLLVGFGSSLKSAGTQLLERVALLVSVVILVAPPTSVVRASVALICAQTVTAATALLLLAAMVSAGRRQLLDGIRSTSATLLRRGARVVAGNVAQFVNYRLDIFLVIAWRGAREGGIYAVAVSLSSVLWYPADAAAQAAYPVACSELRERRIPRRAIRAARLIVTATAAAAVASIPIAQILIPTLLGRAFAHSVAPFSILVLGVAALAVTKMLSGVLVAAGREARTSTIATSAAAVTLAADFVLIPSHGAVGAAIASTAAYAVSALLTASSLSRTLRIRYRDLAIGRA